MGPECGTAPAKGKWQASSKTSEQNRANCEPFAQRVDVQTQRQDVDTRRHTRSGASLCRRTRQATLLVERCLSSTAHAQVVSTEVIQSVRSQRAAMSVQLRSREAVACHSCAVFPLTPRPAGACLLSPCSLWRRRCWTTTSPSSWLSWRTRTWASWTSAHSAWAVGLLTACTHSALTGLAHTGFSSGCKPTCCTCPL
jgi:hypothetical protein